MNDGISGHSDRIDKNCRRCMKPKRQTAVAPDRRKAMMIFMLAAAMMIAMLIATVFGLHQESQRIRQEARIRSSDRFGLRR